MALKGFFKPNFLKKGKQDSGMVIRALGRLEVWEVGFKRLGLVPFSLKGVPGWEVGLTLGPTL